MIAANKAHQNNLRQRRLNLHTLFKRIFIFGQIFGFLPVSGVLGDDYRRLCFRWAALRTLYSLATIFVGSFICGWQLYNILENFNFVTTTPFLLNFAGIMATILLIKFAKNWPKLMTKWNEIENSLLTDYVWPSLLNFKTNCLIIGFFVLLLTEHTINQSSQILLASKCKTTTYEILQHYLRNMSFLLTGYKNLSLPHALMARIYHFQTKVGLLILDILIMTISVVLADRFKQISDKVEMASKRNCHPDIWKRLRIEYTSLYVIYKKVNHEIGYMVLLVFAVDLYFILIQLSYVVQNMRSTLENLYYNFSFSMLIFRLVLVSLIGAEIYEKSKKPLIYLNTIQTPFFNLEIGRFILQIQTLNIALNGNGLFYITRNLILSIAGSIVTYELVLIQFNKDMYTFLNETIGPCGIV